MIATGLGNLIGQPCCVTLLDVKDQEKARAELADLTAEYRRTKGEFEDAREALTAGVRSAADDGMRQADIVRAIDHEWTGEHVRKILKNRPGEVDGG